MLREVLRAKVHRATVTEADVEYEGSLTLDSSLMEVVGLAPYEKVDVYDIDNGSRFSTYLLPGPPDSGVVCVNGAAARLVEPGHRVIICAYGYVTPEQLHAHEPKGVLVDGDNKVVRDAR